MVQQHIPQTWFPAVGLTGRLHGVVETLFNKQGDTVKLQPALSAYLDFLRFFAALAVFLTHLSSDGVSMRWLPLAHLGHEAVVVFFVLSGFIIHQSTTSRQSTAHHYAAARLSRIYSVALLAVAYCACLALIFAHAAPDVAAKMAHYKLFAWSDVFSSLLFLNESWQNPGSLSLNAPFWSLCYEVWFYVLFGVLMFAQGRSRWQLLILVAILAGPAILVLFPVWLMGVWLSARGQWERPWHLSVACAGFILPWVIIGIFSVYGLRVEISDWLKVTVPGFWRLGMSQHLVTDYLYGVLMVIHIRSFVELPVAFQGVFQRMAKQLAYLAGFSFTLYLFHYPMTQFIGAVAPSPEGKVLYPLAVAVAIVVICWLISFGTERQLPAWRRGISRLLSGTNAKKPATP